MGLLPKIFSSVTGGEELTAVFHIGSSSVCAALVRVNRNGLPNIIFSLTEPIAPLDKINVKNFLTQTMRVFDTVGKKISTSSFGAPKKIFCILSSPWYISQNRTIKLEKNTPFVFNSKLADSLLEKEIKLFEEEHLAKYVNSENKIRALEVKNIKTMLNGYEISDPCDQKAKSLEMTLFISISGEDVLSKIENITMKHFHTKEIIFSSFLMSSFAVVRDMYTTADDFLLIDIGGEVTDISMVKKNLLRESISYPMGRNFILRGISSNLDLNLDEAKSLFFLFKDGHAEDKTQRKLEPVMNDLKNEWLKKFQSSLANLSKDISMPATIFITIDQEYSNFFADIIKTEQFNQYTLTESKFQIVFLNAEILHRAAVFENETIRDTFLIIDSIFINRFLIGKKHA